MLARWCVCVHGVLEADGRQRGEMVRARGRGESWRQLGGAEQWERPRGALHL